MIIAAALCLGGCSTKTAWVKPGASEDDFARDSHECERDALAGAGGRGPGLAGGGGLAAAIGSGEYQRRCLRLRGWRQAGEPAAERPAPNGPPAAAPAPGEAASSPPGM